MPLYNKKGLAKASADHQSALNHIPGVSVPHCTKHIPGSAAVPVAIKCGGAQRDVSPTDLNSDLKSRALGADAGETTYGQLYRVDPGHDYSVDPRDGHRGRAHPPAALAAPKPFQAQSTYQAEIGRCANGGSWGRGLQAGCEPSGSAAGPAAPLVKPGYLSQYTAASLPLQQRLGAGGAGRSSGSMAADSRAPGAAAAALAGGRAGGSLADACAVMSRFEGATTYGQMYTTAPGVGACATDELNRGTAKTSLHLPGYGGHVPSEAQLLPAGGPSGSARVKREDALLYHLDQHSRGLVPGYTGHRPQDKARVSLQAPVPTAATTQGAAQQQALRWGTTAAPSAAALNSRAGTLGFFSSGSGGGAFVSENGLAEAAMFHQLARPYEGQMRTAKPSATNRCGSKFTS